MNEAEPSPDEDAAARLEVGRRLFAAPCTFVRGATKNADLPPAGPPEVAFIGRSNVGKSSLINALTGHNGLARTSVTPGRTQQINFFDLAGRLTLVDLPGYGYAKAPKKLVESWNGLIRNYLKGRAPLRRTLVLIDARHGLKDSDHAMMDLLDKAAVNYQAVLTKADKIGPTSLATRLKDTAQQLARHPAAHPEIAATSAEKGTGIAELRATLATLASEA
ncbi:ribosome biogenesis GTP-binding protein YihA/YsxC [Roseospirillum parvum]|uniref:Probable GTP-binding protein EngB n=1 Tax=Roseospirillum parvum TaxID=83401 RepID=A0A1G7WQA0_9PROT|nr:ribosome biogenesis GTP-binding protein YihA/YsxC [Roseospirillum parvum]SDG74083.1 GTP-binding protein [Roseospirillum parvum]